MPSVHAMFRGVLPQPEPHYWPYLEYTDPARHTILPWAFSKEHEYITILVSNNPNVSSNENYLYNGTRLVSHNPYFDIELINFTDDVPTAEELMRRFCKTTKLIKREFFAFFILLETHIPFMGKDNNEINQIRGIEYLDSVFEQLFDIKKDIGPTRVIITSDHGQEWGSDKNSLGHDPSRHFQRVEDNKLIKQLEVFNIEGLL